MRNKNSKFWKYRSYWGKENPDQRAISKSSMYKLNFVPYGPGHLLDVGSGSGLLTAWLRDNKGYSVVGIDSSAEAEKGCSLRNVPFMRVNTETDTFPFPAECFDIVTCFEVIEHIRDPYNLLTEIYRVLKPDGAFIISTPNVAWWYLRVKLLLGIWDFHDSDHMRFFTPRLLEECLNDFSFAVKEKRSVSRVPKLWVRETTFLHNISYDFFFNCKKYR
jgi:2-polyprenyl-3-methyl-5-hydroxy-6-metoxy-1,4-benzoquinol methylase